MLNYLVNWEKSGWWFKSSTGNEKIEYTNEEENGEIVKIEKW